jgi:hypothetical protein
MRLKCNEIRSHESAQSRTEMGNSEPGSPHTRPPVWIWTAPGHFIFKKAKLATREDDLDYSPF